MFGSLNLGLRDRDLSSWASRFDHDIAQYMSEHQGLWRLDETTIWKKHKDEA